MPCGAGHPGPPLVCKRSIQGPICRNTTAELLHCMGRPCFHSGCACSLHPCRPASPSAQQLYHIVPGPPAAFNNLNDGQVFITALKPKTITVRRPLRAAAAGDGCRQLGLMCLRRLWDAAVCWLRLSCSC